MGELQHRHLPKYHFGAHFLTAKTYNNTPYFRVPACANLFCEELEAARMRYGFHILAFVVMPDHSHLLLWWDVDQLPGGPIAADAGVPEQTPPSELALPNLATGHRL
ncbi:MAG: hypothetical protein ACUVTG_15475 [Candidatus Oleimicrobiaceae bacterium]